MDRQHISRQRRAFAAESNSLSVMPVASPVRPLWRMRIIAMMTVVIVSAAHGNLAVCQDTTDAGLIDAQIIEQRKELDQKFAEALESLAVKCEELKKPKLAELTRLWQIPRDPRRQTFFLVEDVDPTAPAENAEKLDQQWYAQFRTLRSDYADKLFALAEANNEKEPAAAFQLLFEVVRENPDHADARRLLGYRQSGERWLKADRLGTPRTSTIRHPVFGWEPRSYWRLDSEHFEILTNHSAKQALELAEELETLYEVWQQAYFTFWSTDGELARRWKSSIVSGSRKQFSVVLFADQPEYLRQLGAKEGSPLSITKGVYYDDKQKSFFFAAGDPEPEDLRPTWWHEASHQLFQEFRTSPRAVGLRDNFWAVEAAALYMESMQKHQTPVGTYYTLGGVDAERLQYARYRRRNQGYYVPLTDLVLLGRADYQSREDLRMLYSQTAGLAHFFQDAQGGKYRASFQNYLQKLYADRGGKEDLFRQTEESGADLDKQYNYFLTVTNEDLAAVPAPERAPLLCLAQCPLTDAVQESLARFKNLQRLDLAQVPIGTSGVEAIRSMPQLQILNVEGTRIDPAALEIIGTRTTLLELDLSKTTINDAAIASLTKLSKLQYLWLTGTKVGDAATSDLAKLRELTYLNVNETQISAEAWQRLQRQLPKLQTQN